MIKKRSKLIFFTIFILVFTLLNIKYSYSIRYINTIGLSLNQTGFNLDSGTVINSLSDNNPANYIYDSSASPSNYVQYNITNNSILTGVWAQTVCDGGSNTFPFEWGIKCNNNNGETIFFKYNNGTGSCGDSLDGRDTFNATITTTTECNNYIIFFTNFTSTATILAKDILLFGYYTEAAGNPAGNNILSISNNLTSNYNYTNTTNPSCNLNINTTGYLLNTTNNIDLKLYINGTLNTTYNNKVFDSNNATEINFSFKNMDGQYNFSFVANNTALSNFTNKNIALSCIEGFHPVDTTPPKISNINNVSVTNNSVYISFDLNELAFYSPSVGTIFSACNNNSPINYSYVIGTNYYNITGLINNSKYCGIINAVDLNSNANQSDYFWFTTLNNTWTVTPPSNDTGNNGNNNTVSYNITGIETQLSNFNDNFKTWSLIFLSLVMIIVTIVSIKLTEFMYLLFICPIGELAGYFIYYDNLPMFRNLGFLICLAYFIGYVIISFVAVFVTMQNKKSAENKKRQDAQFYNRNNFYR